MFPSPRYTVEAITHLLTQVSAQTLLSSDPSPPLANEILNHHPMRTFTIPPLETLLSSTPNPYPYTKTFAQTRQSPFVALHTSGTTGLPKPIIWTHDWAASYIASLTLPTPAGRQGMQDVYFHPRKRGLYLFPPFHASGVIGHVMLGLCTGTILVTPPPTRSPAEAVEVGVRIAEYLSSTDERTGCARGAIDFVALPPPHVEFLGANTALLRRLSARVPVATWSGGDVSSKAGGAVSREMRLFGSLGSTELGMWPVVSPGARWVEGVGGEEGWHYVRFHPGLGLRFDGVGGCGEGEVCECVIVKNGTEGDGKNEEELWVQPIFKIMNDGNEVRLGDLFVRHPRHAGLWKHFGRADDLLTFVSGEKFHPAEAERRISGLDCVEEVLMVGTKRPRAALIVRLKEVGNVDDMWREVQKINKMSPADARVEKDMVLVVNEPFAKTAKGSVRRAAVVDKYEERLNELYKKAGL